MVVRLSELIWWNSLPTQEFLSLPCQCSNNVTSNRPREIKIFPKFMINFWHFWDNLWNLAKYKFLQYLPCFSPLNFNKRHKPWEQILRSLLWKPISASSWGGGWTREGSRAHTQRQISTDVVKFWWRHLLGKLIIRIKCLVIFLSIPSLRSTRLDWTLSLFVESQILSCPGRVNQIFNVVIRLRFAFYCLLLEGDKSQGSIKSFIRWNYLWVCVAPW